MNTIDYAIRCSIAKAIKYTKAETVVDFLFKKIFIYYSLSKKLLLDNNTNLLVNVLKYYL